MRVSTIILSLLFGACAASAQVADTDVKYRLGQSYERSGDFESAARLYEEVFRRDSANMLLFDALRRSYLQLKRYDDCVALMEHVLRRIPNDVSILAQLGSVYILKSDEKSAGAVWERALAVDPKSEMTYRTVAGAVVASRLFDRAIGLYQRGRAAVGDPNLFAFDIAYLQAITLNYPEATREYLRMIRQNPSQLAYVQARIATYTARANGLSSATTVAEEAVAAEPGAVVLRQLLAWLYLEGKRFDKAYAVYKEIDERTGARGHELFAFAERALHERAAERLRGDHRRLPELRPRGANEVRLCPGARSLRQRGGHAPSLRPAQPLPRLGIQAALHRRGRRLRARPQGISRLGAGCPRAAAHRRLEAGTVF
jgi:tetratricopeptide (TPR) repeat protein